MLRAGARLCQRSVAGSGFPRSGWYVKPCSIAVVVFIIKREAGTVCNWIRSSGFSVDTGGIAKGCGTSVHLLAISERGVVEGRVLLLLLLHP